MNWFVLYVHSRAEKKVAERLSAKGFDVFCPLRKVLRQWSDRKKIVELPYFSSYVFVQMELKNRTVILETPGVVNMVFWLKKPAIIRKEEMRRVIDFFESNKGNDIIETSLVEGQEVNIVEGALKDLKGIVIKKSKYQVTLEMRQLGIAFKVQVSTDKVEVISNRQ